ncbi:hypothetical protein OSB04_011832 [Centaurea solstitialis]|uniref:Integrase catalytic domain-containing protein n=1 Tax=Centaurea solstitialis TaxID=347529 RepID=A0AA38TA80_9ASTR|nr:hypothetical protein OSB04_011832 [Centaurea solstitialis]
MEKQTSDLYYIVQKTSESICDYFNRFNAEMINIRNCDVKTTIEAYKRGLDDTSGFYVDLRKYPPENFDDIRARTLAYMRIEVMLSFEKKHSNDKKALSVKKSEFKPKGVNRVETCRQVSNVRTNKGSGKTFRYVELSTYNFAVVNANNVSAQLAGIPTLNGTNYAMWKESVEIVLGYIDLDHALRMERPNSTTENPNTDKIEKWDRSNRMCLMIMKRSIPSTFRGSIIEGTNAKNFLKEIEQFFAKNAKTEASNTLMKLVTMRYKEKGNIREYIMEMSNLNGKLKELKLELSDDLLVHLILISLPAQFGQFVVSYNTQKDKWTLNELMSDLVQEEERLKRDKTESAHLASTSQDKKKKRAKGTAENVSKQKKHKKQDKEFTYFFCKKVGHIKKECPKYASWREKHGKYLTFVCTEVNLAFVSEDTWWVDSGATAHISMSMQGCLWSRSPTNDEKFIYVGDGAKVKVKAIGTFRLLLKTGFYLDLVETFIVPSFRRNLISVSCLDKFGYSCLLGNNKGGFYLNSNLVGTGSLIDKLYMLETVALDNEILHSVAKSNKRKLNEDSAILWHKRLGHISKQRIQRLIDERILNSIDLTNFQVCVECIKGKQTNARRLGSNRATDVLELIHTDICGPFPTASWNGQQYFITFIDDYSRYGYLYLIHEKSQSLDVFKNFKAEVELQLGKKIKAVRSDCGGEY